MSNTTTTVCSWCEADNIPGRPLPSGAATCDEHAAHWGFTFDEAGEYVGIDYTAAGYKSEVAR